MSPSHTVAKRALFIGLIALMVSAVPAVAQSLIENARQLLDLQSDPLVRSPRQLGMGGLTLVGPDAHLRITMWDFAENPTGLGDADTATTLEIRPSTSAISYERDIVGSAPLQVRQVLAARDVSFGFEAFKRPSDGSGTTFGMVGAINRLRFDQPITADEERRSRFSVPDLTAAVNGPMPLLSPDRMKYAVRVTWRNQENDDTYHSIFDNAAGEFIDKDGGLLPTPDFFTADDFTIKTLGLGVAASYTWGDPLTLAVGYDRLTNELLSRNTGDRHESEIREDRPYNRGQVSLIGKAGETLSYGADFQSWSSTSDERWVFTISAGPGNPPLTGRGNRLGREETGWSGRGRARWRLGPFEAGAGARYADQEVKIIAPEVGDPNSFNMFRNLVFNTTGADTLALPDSIVSNTSKEKLLDLGGGLAWKGMDERATVGAEFHWLSDKFESLLNGEGPERKAWEVRSGAEYVVSPAVSLRGGYIHRSDDRDELTSQNETLANAVTVGLGFRPMNARWVVDAGYVFEWSEADYGDPGQPRSTRQRLGTQVRWVF